MASRIEGFEFEVGVLDDKPHYDPVDTPRFGQPEIKQYAGGPARKQTRTQGPLSIAEIFIANMERLGINLLLKPFQDESSELRKFTTAFLKLATGDKGMNMKRVENLLQAVVRNPILRQEYGKNSGAAADNKGFDRHLIDTAQMFKNLKARASRVRK